jgi:hypothetical protein
MGNIFNLDFLEFLLALNKNEVNYVLVGGYSVIYHGFPRTTGDIDIFVEVVKSNDRLFCSLFTFGNIFFFATM